MQVAKCSHPICLDLDSGSGLSFRVFVCHAQPLFSIFYPEFPLSPVAFRGFHRLR